MTVCHIAIVIESPTVVIKDSFKIEAAIIKELAIGIRRIELRIYTYLEEIPIDYDTTVACHLGGGACDVPVAYKCPAHGRVCMVSSSVELTSQNLDIAVFIALV